MISEQSHKIKGLYAKTLEIKNLYAGGQNSKLSIVFYSTYPLSKKQNIGMKRIKQTEEMANK